MENKAVKLSLAAVWVFLAAAVGLGVGMPWLARWYAGLRQIREAGRIAILAAFYGCLPFALTALLCLRRLLRNILEEKVFLPRNSRLMAVVSWCCAAAALITGVCACLYPPLLFVTVSMAFIFLIVRVVRNCFIAAIVLKEENSLTI